jgi:hypothetical protein
LEISTATRLAVRLSMAASPAAGTQSEGGKRRENREEEFML